MKLSLQDRRIKSQAELDKAIKAARKHNKHKEAGSFTTLPNGDRIITRCQYCFNPVRANEGLIAEHGHEKTLVWSEKKGKMMNYGPAIAGTGCAGGGFPPFEYDRTESIALVNGYRARRDEMAKDRNKVTKNRTFMVKWFTTRDKNGMPEWQLKKLPVGSTDYPKDANGLAVMWLNGSEVPVKDLTVRGIKDGMQDKIDSVDGIIAEWDQRFERPLEIDQETMDALIARSDIVRTAATTKGHRNRKAKKVEVEAEVEAMEYGDDIMLYASRDDKWHVVRRTVIEHLSDGTKQVVEEPYPTIYMRNPDYDGEGEPEWIEVAAYSRIVPKAVARAYDKGCEPEPDPTPPKPKRTKPVAKPAPAPTPVKVDAKQSESDRLLEQARKLLEQAKETVAKGKSEATDDWRDRLTKIEEQVDAALAKRGVPLRSTKQRAQKPEKPEWEVEHAASIKEAKNKRERDQEIKLMRQLLGRNRRIKHFEGFYDTSRKNTILNRFIDVGALDGDEHMGYRITKDFRSAVHTLKERIAGVGGEWDDRQAIALFKNAYGGQFAPIAHVVAAIALDLYQEG